MYSLPILLMGNESSFQCHLLKKKKNIQHPMYIHLRDMIHPSFPFVTCSKDQNNQSASTCSNIYEWWTNVTMKPD